MKQTLTLKPQQRLNMTPQLQQAIRLLQLSAQELDIEIQTIVETNPLLEIDHSEQLNHHLNNYPNDSQSFNDQQQGYQEYQNEYQNQKAIETTLQQHLLWQINFSAFSSTERLIANTLIDAISEDGYLSCNLEEIQDTLRIQSLGEFAMAEIESVLHKIQQFEPLGIAARQLSECLYIQLNHLPPNTSWLTQAKQLVRSHLPLLGSKNYPSLCSILNVSQQNLKRVIDLITKLDPKPGQQIHLSKRSECIIPDLLLKKKNGKFVVELNMDTIPKLRINTNYASLLKSVGTEQETLFFRQHLKEAKWFLKGLENRYSTLLKVANCMVTQQSRFLSLGEEFMQGLSLEAIAKMTNLHESTISRVTTHKYIHTHRGTFELKHFFSTQIQADTGETYSTTSIKAMIKKLIREEASHAPLSDEQIKELLLNKKIPLSRRTVSKYREAMQIPSSKKRQWTKTLTKLN